MARKRAAVQRGAYSDAQVRASERWALPARTRGTGPLRVLLAYPCPYRVAAASLGYQWVYRLLRSVEGLEVDRAWLPSGRGQGLAGVDTGRPASEFHVLAVSLAYELELDGLVRLLEAAGLAPLSEERLPRDPVILLGGPITLASASFTFPFVDLVVPGEAEEVLPGLMGLLAEAGARKPAFLEALGREQVLLPSLGLRGEPELLRAPVEMLPARAAWTSGLSSFPNMFLVEVGRGCSRSCAYCVMQRSCSGGLRAVPSGRVLEAIPAWAPRVGLVGAAVTDHPELRQILEACLSRGQEVGLSSLRADRLSPELVELLHRGGLRTLTTALDGGSQRVRDGLRRGTRPEHLLAAARLAREQGLPRMKIYLMVGLPGEEEQDLDEAMELFRELSGILPIALSISPFVPKARTPLADAGFAGVSCIEQKIGHLRRGLRGKVRMHSVSARWAWVEHCLAQGGEAAGRAGLDAVQEGGSLAAWRRAMGGAKGLTNPRT